MFKNIKIYWIIMESISISLSAVLTKFSNAIWILQFYGYNQDCSTLMSSLWSATREQWTKNAKLYSKHILIKRRVLEYIKTFDNKFADFLLLNDRYKHYKLVVYLSFTNDKYVKYFYHKSSWVLLIGGHLQHFFDFIDKVTDLSELCFHKVYTYK